MTDLRRCQVGNARLEGLTTDLHMSKVPCPYDAFKLTLHLAGDQYLTGLTLFFIGYVLFEVSKPDPC